MPGSSHPIKSDPAMQIRCPHCHHPIEVVDEKLLDDLVCPSCGSNITLISKDTTVAHEGSALGSTARLEPRRLGHFELLDQVGVGGFGAVWKARDTVLDRIVAVKIPRRGQLNASEAEYFLRDARAAAQLRHPNIVSVHEVGRDGDTFFIASDFIDGANLHEWLQARKLTVREAAELVAQIAEAVQHAHERGVVHRDLKPGNILMDSAGRPHLTDFGLAKRETGEITMTVDGQILGTPAYMSPEQARGKAHEADAKSDVYSLGVILFELLTSELPFRGEKRMLIVQILNDEPPSPRKLNGRVTRDLETICLKCLEKEPKKRYATTAELAADLHRFLNGETILAWRVGRLERGWRWCRRNALLSATTVSTIAALVSGMIISCYFAWVANNRASELSDNQQQLERELRINVSSRLAGRAHGSPQYAFLVAEEAVRATARFGEPPTPEAERALRAAAARLKGHIPHQREVPSEIGMPDSSAALSSDGNWLMTRNEARELLLWDLKDVTSHQSPTFSRKGVLGSVEVIDFAVREDTVVLLNYGERPQGLNVDRPILVWTISSHDAALRWPLPLQGDNEGIRLSCTGQWLVELDPEQPQLWSIADRTAIPLDHSQLGCDRQHFPKATFSERDAWLIVEGPKASVLYDLSVSPPALRGVQRQISSSISPSTAKHSRVTSFTSDERHLLFDDGFGAVMRWKLDSFSADVGQKLVGPSALSALSPDGRWIAESTSSGVVIWSLTKSAECRRLATIERSDPSTSIAFSRSGQWLVVWSASQGNCYRLAENNRDAEMQSLTVASGPTFSSMDADILRALMLPDDLHLLVLERSASPRFYHVNVDLSPWEPKVLWRQESTSFTRGALRDNGYWLASVNGARALDVWHSEPSTLNVTHWTFPGAPNDTREMRFDTAGGLLVIAPAEARHLSLSSKESVWRNRNLGDVNLSSFIASENGRWLVAVGRNAAWRFDLDSRDVLESALQFEFPDDTGHGNIALETAAVSMDGRWMTVGTAFGRSPVLLLDLSKGLTRAHWRELHGHDHLVSACQFSPDSRHLLTCGADYTLRSWDLLSDPPGQSIAIHDFRSDFVECDRLQVTRDGRWVVMSQNQQELSLLPWSEPIQSAARRVLLEQTATINNGSDPSWTIESSGHWLLAVDSDDRLFVWNLASELPETTKLELRWPTKHGTISNLAIENRWVGAADSYGDLYYWRLRERLPQTTGVFLYSTDHRYVTDLHIHAATNRMFAANPYEAVTCLLDLGSVIELARRRVDRGLTEEERFELGLRSTFGSDPRPGERVE